MRIQAMLSKRNCNFSMNFPRNDVSTAFVIQKMIKAVDTPNMFCNRNILQQKHAKKESHHT